MISWPDELISDLARRKCIIFLGAGVSMNSANASGRRPKSWKTFLEDALAEISPNRHIRTLINKNDFLTACEIIKSKLGPERFNTIVLDEYLTPGYRPAPIHTHIYNLDSRIVMTPNFDKIYETCANNIASGSVQIKSYGDNDVAEAIRRPNRLVIKAHGSIDQPDQMIFSRAEYSEAKVANRDFYIIFEALILTHTFLFVGCGLNDPDIKLLLEDYSYRFKCARNHYFVIPTRTIHNDEADVLKSAMNLKFITYSSEDNHKELTDSLLELSDIVGINRNDLATTQNW